MSESVDLTKKDNVVAVVVGVRLVQREFGALGVDKGVVCEPFFVIDSAVDGIGELKKAHDEGKRGYDGVGLY